MQQECPINVCMVAGLFDILRIRTVPDFGLASFISGLQVSLYIVPPLEPHTYFFRYEGTWQNNCPHTQPAIQTPQAPRQHDCFETTGARHHVLVVDVSGSMNAMGGAPIREARNAAQRFVDLATAVSGHYIAIVAYSDNATLRANFTNDHAVLTSAINGLIASGSTNNNAGLELAERLINDVSRGYISANVLLFSDGLPNRGSQSTPGPFSATLHRSHNWQHANAVVNTARRMMGNGIDMWSVGFFHDISGDTLVFAREFKNHLQNRGYFDVIYAGELQWVFEEIATDMMFVCIEREIPGITDDMAIQPPPLPSNVRPADRPLLNRHSPWARDTILLAFEHDLVPEFLQGDDVDFTRPITRAEFAGIAVMLYTSMTNRLAMPSLANPNPFDDTRDPYVLRAYNNHLMIGVDSRRFAPYDLIEREQAAAALARAYMRIINNQWTVEMQLLNHVPRARFADHADISSWAVRYVYFMAANNIMHCIGNNVFLPRSTVEAQQAFGYAVVTREQALDIALRLLVLM